METKARIALVIKTDGLEYDDRVRKEILTIQKLYPYLRFKIFVMFPKNKETDGVTSYGVPYHSVYIPSRDKYPSSQKTALKSYEFYKAIKNELNGYDAVWCANEDTAMVAALVRNKHLLWDLHELPSTFLGNYPKRVLLKLIFSRCKVVVHANPQRELYLESIGVITKPSKHFALRNFPSFEDKDAELDEVYHKFVEWKRERTCVYLQGLTNSSRAAFESISAVLQISGLIAVVVGGFDKDSMRRLEDTYGNELNERVFFIGKVPQLKIPQYVEKCQLSLIFYKNVRPNNWYCEANRFYQSVIMGLPVVVGNNPPMKEIVEQYGFGVSIDDDGRDVIKIKQGIERVLNDYDTYILKNNENRERLMWSNQDEKIKEIMDCLLK